MATKVDLKQLKNFANWIGVRNRYIELTIQKRQALAEIERTARDDTDYRKIKEALGSQKEVAISQLQSLLRELDNLAVPQNEVLKIIKQGITKSEASNLVDELYETVIGVKK